jgi:FlaA1/EpsC-like NDP-sugar epimerase
MGSAEFRAFVRDGFDYDVVLNFAALKHVRAERDPYSLLRMLNTNFVYLDDFLNNISPDHSLRQVFSVSSDKSVNPASLLGSSKALMEEVLWKHEDRFITTSARFANVAFSSGSLLESFLQRMSKRQPLAAPNDVRRFFISHEEAGELCLLGAFLGESGDIVFPKLNPQSDMLTFAEIALTVLEHFGYEARHCDDELEARVAASSLTGARSSPWPVYFSASDTTGEKMFEEFYGDDESVSQDRWDGIGVVSKSVLAAPAVANLDTCLDELRAATNDSRLSKQKLISIIQPLMPGPAHAGTGRNLDEKM